MVVDPRSDFARFRLAEIKLFFGQLDLTVLDEGGAEAIQNAYSRCEALRLSVDRKLACKR